MPRNKSLQGADEKKAEIIEAARKLFLEAGYEATPVGAIATAAGVAVNTIYWYFKDKDELLLAVLDELFQESVAEFMTVARRPLSEQLLWLVNKLQSFSHLVATLHNRIHESKALDQWHNQFHTTVEQFFGLQLQQRMAKESIPVELRIAAYTIEGLVTHNVDKNTVRLTCEALASRWAKV
jgi:TetR/AcrR family transcriptional regulator, cholesterol catabolism regulator